MDALDEQARGLVRGFVSDARVMRHTPSPVHLLAVSLAHLESEDLALSEELGVSARAVAYWTGQNLAIDPRYLPLPPSEDRPPGQHAFTPESDESRDRWLAATEAVVAVVNQAKDSLGENADFPQLLRRVILAVLDDNDVQACLTEYGGNLDAWRERLEG